MRRVKFLLDARVFRGTGLGYEHVARAGDEFDESTMHPRSMDYWISRDIARDLEPAELTPEQVLEAARQKRAGRTVAARSADDVQITSSGRRKRKAGA